MITNFDTTAFPTNNRKSSSLPEPKFVRDSKVLLVVEDDLSIRHLLLPIIDTMSEPVNIEWVTSFEEAQRRLLQKEHDMLLVDFLLEGDETGWDLWKHCQMNYPDTPFIFLSGISKDTYYGLFEYHTPPPLISKPLNADEVRDTLEIFLI